MALIESQDIIPLGQVRAKLTEIAEEVHGGGKEKIVTRNGQAYIAIIDVQRLDHYHRLERELIHLTLLDEAERGLADVEAGRTIEASAFRKKMGR